MDKEAIKEAVEAGRGQYRERQRLAVTRYVCERFERIDRLGREIDGLRAQIEDEEEKISAVESGDLSKVQMPDDRGYASLPQFTYHATGFDTR